MRLGALEAGGTKMVCAIGCEDGTILEQRSFPTLTPEETMPHIVTYFKERNINALGIGAFGPVDVNPSSETLGEILDTPKLAWRHYPIYRTLKNTLQVPMMIDTDVNGSCLGEITFGCAKGLNNVLYLTIGTGIGAGIAINGQLLHGMLHPEAGHILLKRHSQDNFEGCCPYHKDCFEGLASGTAIEARYQAKAKDLANRDEVWELEAYYIAQALVNFSLTLSVEKIILGGGVMHQKQLFPKIREKYLAMMHGYLNTKELKKIEEYIVPAGLNDDQGIMGALQLAKMALM